MNQRAKRALRYFLKEMQMTYRTRDIDYEFNVQEPIENWLHGAIQDSSDFLKQIMVIPADDKVVQNVEMSVAGTLSKRTDTSKQDRFATPVGNPTGIQSELVLTEFDLAVGYDYLDVWSSNHDGVFDIITQQLNRRIALDRIHIGFHGTHAAKETDRDKHPNLEDANIGWYQLMRDNMPENVLTETSNGTGEVSIGQYGDYKNLYEMVYDIYCVIDEKDKTGNEVAIVGQYLMNHYIIECLSQYFHIPSEKMAVFFTPRKNTVQMLKSSIGTLPTMEVPGFPQTGLMIVDPKNLHLYYQAGKTRKKIENNAKRSQLEIYTSCNDAYSIGNFAGCACIEPDNVVFANEKPEPLKNAS